MMKKETGGDGGDTRRKYEGSREGGGSSGVNVTMRGCDESVKPVNRHEENYTTMTLVRSQTQVPN